MSKKHKRKLLPPPPRPATIAIASRRNRPLQSAVLAFTPGISPRAFEAHQLGLRLREKRKFAEAIAAFRASLNESPQFVEALNDLGLTLIHHGDNAEALNAFQRALEIKPDHAIAWNNLGTLWLSLGNYDEALPCFEKAVQFAPDVPDLRKNLDIARREQAAARPLNFESASSTQRTTPITNNQLRITLCLIAKNESANLPRLFESVRGAVDEIVVVDTGSTDDTVALAQAAGAKVAHFPWRNDFAAAKNEALRHATGQWIFFLDADMALFDGHAEKIRRAVASGAARSYFVNIHSPLADGVTEDVVAHSWLFENAPGVKFEGAIHETVHPSLTTRDMNPAQTDIAVHHFGYSSEAALAPRLERNLAALRQQAESGNAKPIIHFYLGTTLLGLKRYDGAMAELKQAIASPELHWRVRANASYALIRAHAARGDLAGATASAEEAATLYPRDRMAWALRGKAALQAGNFDLASQSFSRALSLHETLGAEASFHNISDAGLEHDLGQALACIGRNTEAIEHYERALNIGLPATTARSTHSTLGFLHYLQNQPEPALKHVAEVPADEQTFEALEMLATVARIPERIKDYCQWLVSTGRATDAARARLGQPLLNPTARAEELATHAQRLRNMGMVGLSLKKIQQAITIAPARPGLHRELGDLYKLAGDKVHAAQAYAAELSLDPLNVPTYYSLGLLYQQDGNLPEAAAWFELAVKVDPAHEPARQSLATVRQQ